MIPVNEQLALFQYQDLLLGKADNFKIQIYQQLADNSYIDKNEMANSETNDHCKKNLVFERNLYKESFSIIMIKAAIEYVLQWTPQEFIDRCTEELYEKTKIKFLVERNYLIDIKPATFNRELLLKIVSKCYPDEKLESPSNIKHIRSLIKKGEKIPSKLFDGPNGELLFRDVIFDFILSSVIPSLPSNKSSLLAVYEVFQNDKVIHNKLKAYGIYNIIYNRYASLKNGYTNGFVTMLITLLPSRDDVTTNDQAHFALYSSVSIKSFLSFKECVKSIFSKDRAKPTKHLL